jgi:hypothetical protein
MNDLAIIIIHSDPLWMWVISDIDLNERMSGTSPNYEEATHCAKIAWDQLRKEAQP